MGFVGLPNEFSRVSDPGRKLADMSKEEREEYLGDMAPFAGAIMDEIPLAGEMKSVAEGNVLGIVIGIFPFGKKIRALFRRLFGKKGKKVKTRKTLKNKKGVRVENEDGTVIDITEERVKEFKPELKKE